MQIYYEITDPISVAKIDEALKPIHNFDEKLHALKKLYGADNTYVFNSLDRGLEFSYLWFEKYPLHLDTEKQFKISTEKHKTGYEVRPRKGNKKFYAEFMSDMENVNYSELMATLFNNHRCRPNITYVKKDNAYYIESDINIVLNHRELTASQYKALTGDKEQ